MRLVNKAMCEVIVLKAAQELTSKEYSTLLTLTSDRRKERIERFMHRQDAYNCLLGDILTRIEVCRVTQLSNRELKFTQNDYGKPLLINNPNIHFNISHSGQYVVCAIADDPIGIDIELIVPVDLRIAERFFSQDEVAYIMEKNQTYRFIEVWTKKESMIKWVGEGLSKPLQSFSVFDSSTDKSIFYSKVFCDGEAVCHTCFSKNVKPTIKIINTVDLLAMSKNL